MVGSLLLQAFRLFNIWSAVLFVVAVVLVELAFLSHANDVELRARREATKPLDPKRALSDIRPKVAAKTQEPWQHRFKERD